MAQECWNCLALPTIARTTLQMKTHPGHVHGRPTCVVRDRIHLSTAVPGVRAANGSSSTYSCKTSVSSRKSSSVCAARQGKRCVGVSFLLSVIILALGIGWSNSIAALVSGPSLLSCQSHGQKSAVRWCALILPAKLFSPLLSCANLSQRS